MGLGLALGPGYEVGESSAAAAARPAGGFRADYGFIATMDRQGDRLARYRVRCTQGSLSRWLDEDKMRFTRGWMMSKGRGHSWRRGWHVTREAVGGRATVLRCDLAHGGDYIFRAQFMRRWKRSQSYNRPIVGAETLCQRLVRDRRQEARGEWFIQGLVATLQGQVTDLQGQVMTLQGQVTTLQGQQGPAGGPAQPELPEEAGSSS
ncbi:hypothetical protein Tco_0066063 [Tanacetum coccineum]